ncbi:nuclear transport factor 2 family protein [uncultured Erythrobacter sp.]|uniref:nuclear transport factor 2 family protein n=1 Tax=uncultured Erythrobacter sp. TaxID=263913 RepID=UPI00265ACCB9|nr:nuclear transport factor 2 family protein [uncultured Erythrobacter sp.]
MNVEAVLQELLDKQAIQELIARYSRTLDWVDDAGQAGCYWPDAAVDYGFFKGTAADFVPVVMAVERSTGRRWHLLSSLAVKLTSATTAEGECYGIALGFRREDEAEPYSGNMYGGRYLDQYEKRDGEWRISSRRYIMDWTMAMPDQPDASPNAEFPLPMLDLRESGHPDYRVM